jgi:uncharacterized protein with PIN domain
MAPDFSSNIPVIVILCILIAGVILLSIALIDRCPGCKKWLALRKSDPVKKRERDSSTEAEFTCEYCGKKVWKRDDVYGAWIG